MTVIPNAVTARSAFSVGFSSVNATRVISCFAESIVSIWCDTIFPPLSSGNGKVSVMKSIFIANMNQSITVAIVTRNRAHDLRECLQSLVQQTVSLAHIIVINNASSDNTSEIIQNFEKLLPVREIFEKKVGYPDVYNRALKEVKTTWIAFIDDDCVADIRWYSEVVKATKLYTGYTAILGTSTNYYSKNPYACAMQFSNEWWRRQSITGTQIIDYMCLDSRNIVYNGQFLKKHHIKFDKLFIGGGEDSDLGLQIKHKRLQVVFVGRMIVHHKEPQNFRFYLNKKYQYYQSQQLLLKKWGMSKESLNSKGKDMQTFLRVFIGVTAKLSFVQRIASLFVIVSEILASRLRLYRIKIYSK